MDIFNGLKEKLDTREVNIMTGMCKIKYIIGDLWAGKETH